MASSMGGGGGSGGGGDGAWGKKLVFAPPVVSPKKTKAEVVKLADTHALNTATHKRTERAKEIKATLLPFVTGGKSVVDRDKSGNMNLHGESVPRLQRSYSAGTLAEFKKLLPSTAHVLDGHKNDVFGQPGFKGNTQGPYENYVFPSTPKRKDSINAHVKIGPSEFETQRQSAHTNYMYYHQDDHK
jgi:hypothetical protein